MTPVIERNRTAQWFQNRWAPKARWTTVRKFLLHTTEGASWPAYDGGAKAPNATLMWDASRSVLHVREHFDPNVAARALRNDAGGPETNAVPGGVHQVEIVGTCDPKTSELWQRHGLKPGVDYIEAWDPPAGFMDALAAYWLDLHDRFSVPLELGSTTWTRYPSSPALDKATRLVGAAWVRARGLVGHEHGDENEHLDPGDFPAAVLLRRAQALQSGTTIPASPLEDDVQLSDKVPMGVGAQKMLGAQRDTVGELLTLAAQGGLAALHLAPAVAQLSADVAVLRQAVVAGGDVTESELIAAGKAGAEAALAVLGQSLTDATNG